MREIFVIAGVLLVFVLAAFVFERQRDFVMQMLDASLFKKSQSSSYIERSAWSHQALKAFIDSNGIGVGVGSVRTSNFFINILASTGILGTGLFALFLLRVFTARVPVSAPQDFEIVRGSKMALIVIFFGLFFIGTVPDYGVLAAALFGVIVGTSMAYRAHLTSSSYPLPDSVAHPFAQSLP
jgi:O-antigen ligase